MADTVLPTQGFKSVGHMNVMGYIIAGAIALVLLPVLPFLLVLWLLGRREAGAAEQRRAEATPD